GGANRNRTDDLLNAIQALSQLSYGPTRSRSRRGWDPPGTAQLLSRALFQIKRQFDKIDWRLWIASGLFVLDAADDIGDVVAFLFLVLDEDVVDFVVADFHVVFIRLGAGSAARGFLV